VTTVQLSVIVPAYQGASTLPLALEALRRSDLPRESWELIVVDDMSTDGTSAVARAWADQVERVEPGPRGPAHARNSGAALARGHVLVFVDADVLVHANTLRRFRDLFAREPDVVAAFGAYDEDPAHGAFLSQYRNLLHRYVHVQDAGDAETFWAGCGAVRRSAFVGVGGFDAEQFPRPQIEDIELGYRLRDRGGRIILDPRIQGQHLKRWTIGNIVRTDLLDRGIPWVRLLIRRKRSSHRRGGTLNVRPLEKIKTVLLGLGVVILAIGALGAGSTWLLWGGFLVLTVALLCLPLYGWFARLRGWGFAVRVIPLNLLYYLISGTSVVVAWTMEALPRVRSTSAGPGDPS